MEIGKGQLRSSVYVATGGHCYATLIKTDIHLIVFDPLVYREIQLITLTLMPSSKARASELRMITRDSFEMIKHHSDGEQTSVLHMAVSKNFSKPTSKNGEVGRDFTLSSLFICNGENFALRRH